MRCNRQTECTKLVWVFLFLHLPPSFFGNHGCQRNLSFVLCQSSEPEQAVQCPCSCWGQSWAECLCLELGTEHSLQLSWGLWQVRDSSCLCHRQSSGNCPQSTLQGSLPTARGSAWSTGTEHTRGSSQPAEHPAGAQLPAQIPANTWILFVPSHHTEAQSPQMNTEGFVTLKKPFLQSARGQT